MKRSATTAAATAVADGTAFGAALHQGPPTNVHDHPGSGLVLPVDAHPAALRWSDGALMRTRVQSYDSTFGSEATESITLPRADVPTTVASSPGVPVFDDHNASYRDPANPYSSVRAPGGREEPCVTRRQRTVQTRTAPVPRDA